MPIGHETRTHQGRAQQAHGNHHRRRNGSDRGLRVERQRSMALVYRGRRLDIGYRLDLLVEDSVVVEVKAVERIEPVHCGQLTSYLRLTGCKVGLLINLNVKWLVQNGIKRIVNGFPD
jgi:GxxExxY protein